MVSEFLLDTHIWLWMHQNPDKLSQSVRKLLENRHNTLYFSVASVWEIVIKYELGKLPLPEIPEIYFSRRLYPPNMAITILPIEFSHALRAGTLPAYHRDPFDRILIAPAQLEKFTLLTVDQQFKMYDLDLLWANETNSSGG